MFAHTPAMRAFAVLLLAASTGATDYDVVVYGSTPGGIAAATAAARLGMTVALYEPLKMLGGMGAAGNLALHDGQSNTFHGTGIALEFAMLNGKHYGVDRPVAQPESFVANASFYTLLAAAGVRKVALDCRLTAAAAAATTTAASPAGGAAGATGVASVSVLCETEPVTATVFIDASYDAEVVVASGVEYTHGREPAAQYNESLGGARTPTPSPVVVDALNDDGTIIKYVQNVSTLAAPGQADDALMAFQHRMCISGDADRLPWKRPEGYNRDDFVLFERYIEASGGGFHGFGWPPQAMKDHGYPGKKDKYTLCCGISIAASDQPNLNKGWANATWDRKQEIIADHTYFELGMFYFLSSDPKVPTAVRDEFNKYGLCADEFVEFGHIPPQLYIRESNRLVGDYVMTQNTLSGARTAPLNFPDGIAVSHWWMDMHMTGKYAVPTGGGKYEYTVQLEGNFPQSQGAVPNPYDIPYRMMLPKRGSGANLLVPVSLSTSHAAFASTRIETMLMGTGTAAGVAAQQLVDGSAACVQDVNVTKVQAILVDVFKQSIHAAGRHPAPPSGPVPQYYNVTGAGDASWNGQYVHTGTYQQAPLYRKQDTPHALYRRDAWRLAVQGETVAYVAGGTGSDGWLPPAGGWVVGTVESPAPALVAGPTGPGVRDPLL